MPEPLSGVERLIFNMLKAGGFDPDLLKNQVIEHVKKFEDAVELLNKSMVTIDQRLAAIETKLGIAATGTADDIRGNVPALSGPTNSAHGNATPDNGVGQIHE